MIESYIIERHRHIDPELRCQKFFVKRTIRIHFFPKSGQIPLLHGKARCHLMSSELREIITAFIDLIIHIIAFDRTTGALDDSFFFAVRK